MTVSNLKMKIRRAEHANLLSALYGILTFMAAFIGAAFLPEIMVRYVLKAQSMDQVPAYLEYMPVVFITVAFLFFVFAVFSTIARLMQMKRWEKEMETVNEACCTNCGGNCSCDPHSNCACGCETEVMTMSSMSEPMSAGSDSSAAMAESMRSLNKKPKARRKSSK